MRTREAIIQAGKIRITPIVLNRNGYHSGFDTACHRV